MKPLLAGIKKYSKEVFPQDKEHFRELAKGQKPHTLFITCSDSRIDPSLITQTKPGELFVIRNAGNLVPPFGTSQGGEGATIEFAVDGLKVSQIVVCGHSQCGAMSALLDKSQVNALPSVNQWLDHAESTLERLEEGEKSLPRAVSENVLAQIDRLKTHPCVTAAVAEGRLKIFGWIYHFEDGVIDIYDSESKRFVPAIEIEEDAKEMRFAL